MSETALFVLSVRLVHSDQEDKEAEQEAREAAWP
jgi:hypothetical protein